MLRVGEPEWEPLLNFAPDHVLDFMWIYAVELTDRTRLQAYKHYWTRDYLHLDTEGRAFIYAGNERYEEVNPPWLLSRVLRMELEERYSVRQNVWPDKPIIRFARSATKHCISRERSLYVIEQCGFQFIDRRCSESRYGPDKRVFTVIHAMNLRNKHLGMYEEAREWRK